MIKKRTREMVKINKKMIKKLTREVVQMIIIVLVMYLIMSVIKFIEQVGKSWLYTEQLQQLIVRRAYAEQPQ